jgi:hypothetical protein
MLLTSASARMGEGEKKKEKKNLGQDTQCPAHSWTRHILTKSWPFLLPTACLISKFQSVWGNLLRSNTLLTWTQDSGLVNGSCVSGSTANNRESSRIKKNTRIARRALSTYGIRYWIISSRNYTTMVTWNSLSESHTECTHSLYQQTDPQVAPET